MVRKGEGFWWEKGRVMVGKGGGLWVGKGEGSGWEKGECYRSEKARKRGKFRVGKGGGLWVGKVGGLW